jgi:hypothetical protein
MHQPDLAALLQPPSAARLAQDVEALRADPAVIDLIAEREHGPRIEVPAAALERAWLELDESYRRLIRAQYLIGRLSRPSAKRLATALGTTAGKVVSATDRGFNELHELVQPNRGFHGLDQNIRQIILRVAAQTGHAANPADLPDFIDLVVEARGFTRPRYDALLAWLEEHGYADIVAKISQTLSAGSRLLLDLQ